MNNLYNQADVDMLISRFERLTPSSTRLWGKMDVAQMLAHCNAAMETAMGKNRIKRLMIFGIIGSMMKKSVLGEKPFAKNSPTDKSYIFREEKNFEEEKAKIIKAIREFHEGGPAKCTTHPHPFFGHYTPEQWSRFQWKHLDHHLRQFGA